MDEKILNLGKFVLPHPPYLLDLAPSDFHVFPSLQNALNYKIFSQYQVKKFVENFWIPVKRYTLTPTTLSQSSNHFTS